MNLRYLKKFSNLSVAYTGADVSFLYMNIMAIDWLISYVVHGASFTDYFAYGFYKLRYIGRSEYITCRWHKKIQAICNPIISDREIFRNKVIFNEKFSDLLGRSWLDVENVTIEVFAKFFRDHPFVFVKDVNGYCGIGIKKYESSECDSKKLFYELVSHRDAHFILEEAITQHEKLSEFHPWSINTIRIVTIYDNTNDIVYIMNARLRMGNLKNSIDNFHAKGICANIDIETGIICSVGYDKQNNEYVEHPITHKQIVGFQIPYWESCKQFVIRVAKRVPTVRYVGWDIVIQNDGTFLLIEGNDNADHDVQQLHNKGLWKQYKSIIKNF